MATLDLGNYILELTLDEIGEYDYEYVLSLTCDGISVLAPWVKGRDGRPDGQLCLTAPTVFDEALRPLLKEEWPVKWEDDELGHWCTLIAYPSAFLYALEMREPFGHNEKFWASLGEAAMDRVQDRMDRAAPKKFQVPRDAGLSCVRLDFAFGNWGMQLQKDLPRRAGGWGELRFSAYVNYALLEQFLDAMRAEREAMAPAPREVG